ncbi:MAG: mannitol-1-phosphate 5-dehydrogenase [Oscillospiraceae bacterium]|nr:mannitol-1-phosphate 5-dehydrogenase [Oscillospiraceae bacterium]
MKQAVMFGAGNIGRGFIGALLERSGWHVTFADVAEPILEAINTQKHYTVHILDQVCNNLEIENISAVSSVGDQIVPAVAEADLVTTAVGPLVIPKIAKPVAEGIKARMNAGCKTPMNVICCENGIRVTSKLKAEVMPLLNEQEAAYADEYIGFVDCAVDRICPKPNFDSILDAAVEEYTEWDVERSAWKGEQIEIDGMTYVDNLPACVERKLFTLNSGHAICAYLGSLKGHATILESIQDPAIGDAVHAAMRESGEGLIKEFNFDPDTHHAYVERIFQRFQNPHLRDEVDRVGREPIRKLSPSDRLIKPLNTAYSYGLPVDHLIFGAAAALHFNCPEDKQSVELTETIRAEGVEAALQKYTGYAPDHPLLGRILDVYRALFLAAKA